ncbi:hypothetical protein WJH17_005455 [Klebsiella pneumoniae]
MSDIKEVISIFKDSLISPIQQAVTFRAKNTFFGSLFISWVIWNWDRIAYFTLSKDLVLDRIRNIKSSDGFSVSNELFVYVLPKSLAYPLMTAIAFTLLYPFFMYAIAFLHRRIMEKIDIFNNAENVKKIKNSKELIEENQAKELIIAKKTAERERDIAKYKEDKIRSDDSVNKIITEYNEKSANIIVLERQIKEYESLLTIYENKIAQFNTEIINLQGILAPLKEGQNQIIKLSIEKDDLERKLQEVSYERDQAKRQILIMESMTSKG